MKEEVLTAKEASKMLGLGLCQIYYGCERGQIPAVKVGRRWLIPRAALNHWLSHCALPSRNSDQDSSARPAPWVRRGVEDTESHATSWGETP